MAKNLKKKKAVKQHGEKIAVVVSVYSRKNANQKSWITEHKNKDGSLSKWGVSKQGHRFKIRIESYSSSTQVEKRFNKAKRQKNISNNVTFKTYYYTGILNKKNEKISRGIKGNIFFFKLAGSRSTFQRNKTLTFDFREVITQLNQFAQKYGIIRQSDVGIYEDDASAFVKSDNNKDKKSKKMKGKKKGKKK